MRRLIGQTLRLMSPRVIAMNRCNDGLSIVVIIAAFHEDTRGPLD
jgi:hypothetical protein